ncbi:MAG: endonuclease/exonuclease/phosphatase family protein [Leptolyngbya sp. SIO1D8]|nr:endonuclease/exonuclease/phosphatase family protein [Leptolyngbya sp. SIO1D8]
MMACLWVGVLGLLLRKHWQLGGIRFCTAIAFGMIAMTGLAWLSSLWWGLGLLTHFRGQYCWILLLCTGVLALAQRPWAVMCLVSLGINLAIVGALYWPPAIAVTQPNEPSLRILHLNLDRHNPQADKLLRYLNTQTVDLLSLQEVTPEWVEKLRAQLPAYRLVALEVQENSQGSALLLPTTVPEKVKIQSVQTQYFPETSSRPLLVAQLSLQGKPLTFLSLHVTRPRNRGTVIAQQVELQAIAEWSQAMQAQGQRVIVMGDFNSTPWAQAFCTLTRQGKLVNSQQGYGWQTTWRAGWPMIFRIAIDHCLHSQGFTTLNRSIGPALGSDHLPLFVELSLSNP